MIFFLLLGISGGLLVTHPRLWTAAVFGFCLGLAAAATVFALAARRGTYD